MRKAGITWEKARVQPMKQYVTANGMLDYEPTGLAQLAPRAAGTVWQVYKTMGAHVKKGDLLVLIESAEVGRAKADFMQSLTQVNVRASMVQRLKAGGGSVPEGTLREAEAALREARIRLFTDQQQLLNLGLPLRLKHVELLPEDRLAQYLRTLGLPETILKDLDLETITANLLPLTAPFDGQVVRHPHAAPGEVVDTKHPLFVVGNVTHLHMDLEIHLEDVALIRVGNPVTFVPENRSGEPGEPAEGKLAHISPEVNEKTRNVAAHAEVENPDGRLRPNTFGTGRILVREVDKAVVVPNMALQTEDRSSYFVFVRQSETTFQVRPVKLGIRAADVTAIDDGVAEGEEVVTTGSHALKSELQKDRIAGGD
jgi:cobalt-zinc-cadmium efflux system membrane fusion protein